MAPKKTAIKRGKPFATVHKATGDAGSEQSEIVSANKRKTEVSDMNATFVIDVKSTDYANNDAKSRFKKNDNDVEDIAKSRNAKSNDQGSASPGSNSEEVNDSPKKAKEPKKAPSKSKSEEEQESSEPPPKKGRREAAAADKKTKGGRERKTKLPADASEDASDDKEEEKPKRQTKTKGAKSTLSRLEKDGNNVEDTAKTQNCKKRGKEQESSEDEEREDEDEDEQPSPSKRNAKNMQNRRSRKSERKADDSDSEELPSSDGRKRRSEKKLANHDSERKTSASCTTSLNKENLSRLKSFITEDLFNSILSGLPEIDNIDEMPETEEEKFKFRNKISELVAKTYSRVIEEIRTEKNKSLFPCDLVVDDFDVLNRRALYVKWSNNQNIVDVFQKTFEKTKAYFSNNCLELETNDLEEISIPKCDIIDIVKFETEKKLTEEKKEEAVTISLNFKVHDYPVSTPILISSQTLSTIQRNTSSSQIKQIGFQHVHLSYYVQDTSTEDEGSSLTSESENEEIKFRKTCQLAQKIDFDGALLPHTYNSTSIHPTRDGVFVDFLIFHGNKQMCRNLANHLGLIYLEDVIAEAGIKADAEIVMQTRSKYKTAKLYTLVQNYIARKLMFGKNNVVITANGYFFNNIKANVKSSILSKGIVENFGWSKMLNYEITLSDKPHILEFVSAINEIVNTTLNVDFNIDAVFVSEHENKIYSIPFPLFSIIPLYILQFFSQLFLKNPNYRRPFSIDSIGI